MNTATIKTKVNRIGVLGQIVSIILIVLMAVSCFALIAGTVVFALLPQDAITVSAQSDIGITVGKSLIGPYMDEISDDVLSNINAELRVNGTEYTGMTADKTADGLVFHAATDEIKFQVARFGYTMLSGLAYCACLLVVFIFLKRLSDGFRRCDSPFDDIVVKRMNVFAWVLLIGSVAASIAEAIANALMMRGLDLELSLNPAGMSDGLHLSFSFAPIFIALIVLFLTMIFRYGAQLQKESDETL